MSTGTAKAVFALLLMLAGADFFAVNLLAGPAWIAANPPPCVASPPPDLSSTVASIVLSASAAPQPATASAAPPAASSAAPSAEVFATIQFSRNSTTIRAESVQALRMVVKEMKGNPGLRPRFEGHADDPGDKAVQDFLSLQRARMARSFVGSSGVDPGRVAVEGFGDTRKLDPSGTEPAGARNRRVEIILK